MYFGGPAWNGWGFWEGRPPDDVCAELTHVDGAHWRHDGSEACAELLERKFAAFVIGLLAASAVVFTAQACSHLLTYHSTTRPLIRALNRNQKIKSH